MWAREMFSSAIRLSLLRQSRQGEAVTGKIIKGIAGFYYVCGRDGILYECKAKGIFRNKNIKPLVGDMVEISVLGQDPPEGNIDQILPRINTLIRPVSGAHGEERGKGCGGVQ